MSLSKPLNNVERTEAVTKGAGRYLRLAEALRIHQWTKNLLVFVPLAMAHKIFDGQALLLTLYAFATWCLCASGVYLLNDRLDLEADRAHPSKRL